MSISLSSIISGAAAGAAFGPWGAVIGAGVGAAGSSGIFGSDFSNLVTGGQYGAAKQTKRAVAAQNKAAEEQANLNKLINRRNMVQQIRSARIKYASALNAAGTSEGVVSSGTLGALSSIGSQASSNLNFMQDQVTSLDAIQTYQNQAAAYAQSAKNTVNKWSTYTSALKTGASTYIDAMENSGVNSTGGVVDTTALTENAYGPSAGTLGGVDYSYNGRNLLSYLGGRYSGIK